MLLSRMFLAVAREDMRVDVHIERRVVKLAAPPFFWCLVRNCQTDVLLVFGWKDGKQVQLSHVLLAGA